MASIRMLCVFFLLLALAGTIQAACDYSKSCSGISYGGSTMSATCKNKAKKNVAASVNLDQCVGNNDGRLVCGGGYFRSCSGITYSGTTVSATCTSKNGQATRSSLDLNNCVANQNGVLACC